MASSLPFTISEINGGLVQAEGLMHIEENTLVFEYETKDTIIGAIKSELKVTKIPINAIDTVEYKSNFFTTRLYLRAQRMQTFANIPGHQRGELKLDIARKHKEEAQEFSKLLNHHLDTYI